MRRAPQDGQKPRHLHEKARARPGEMLVAATVALHSHEAMLKTSAAQIVIELIRHEAGQLRIARVHARQECGQVQCDHRIQCCLFGSVATVAVLITGVRGWRGARVHANERNEVRRSDEGVLAASGCAPLGRIQRFGCEAEVVHFDHRRHTTIHNLAAMVMQNAWVSALRLLQCCLQLDRYGLSIEIDRTARPPRTDIARRQSNGWPRVSFSAYG